MNRKKLAIGIGLGTLGAAAGSAVWTLRRRRAGAGHGAAEAAGVLGRSSTSMAPGIPVGSGKGIDQALRQPDTDLGGGVAGDTTVGLESDQPRNASTIRNDDRTRNTL